MGACVSSEFEKASPEDTANKLGTNLDKGLTTDECNSRLQKYGENILETKKQSIWLRLFSFFLGSYPLDD